MKKALSLCLVLILLISLTACSGNDTESTVEFYYVRNSYIYGAEDGVIASESRDMGSRTLLRLLTLYLRGPLDDDLRSPFPADCSILGVSQDGSTLCVTLDDRFTRLENLDLTIACACLAKTCFSLTDMTQVQIQSWAQNDADSINVVISIDSLLLDDNSGLHQQSVTEEPQ